MSAVQVSDKLRAARAAAPPRGRTISKWKMKRSPSIAVAGSTGKNVLVVKGDAAGWDLTASSIFRRGHASAGSWKAGSSGDTACVPGHGAARTSPMRRLQLGLSPVVELL